MLMFMTGNRAAAAEASASPGDQGPQGASTWLPKSLLEVVESSDAPLAAVELPSGESWPPTRRLPARWARLSTR